MRKTFRYKTFVGGFFEDAGEFVSDATDAIADVATSAWDAVPGSSWVGDAVDTVTGPVGDFARGPLRDFARTSVGETVIRAFSVAVSMATMGMTLGLASPIAATLGSAVAFAAWSIPGLAKGQPFDDALIAEFTYRATKVGEYFAGKAGEEAGKAASKAMGQQLDDGLAYAKNTLGQYFPNMNPSDALASLGVRRDDILQNLGLTPAQLAKKLDIREDVAAYALAWMKRDEMSLPQIRAMYDERSGAKKLTREAAVLSSISLTQNIANVVKKPLTEASVLKSTMKQGTMISVLPSYQEKQAQIAAAREKDMAFASVLAEANAAPPAAERDSLVPWIFGVGVLTAATGGWFLYTRGMKR